jgi:hypothetical protein
MRAEKVSEQTPHRTPRTLFAAIMMPWPLPQSTIPNRQSPEATSRAAASPCLGYGVLSEVVGPMSTTAQPCAAM